MTTSRPLVVDLFCGPGGSADGWMQAGFDVLGVDLNPQPSYPYPFIQADALSLDASFFARAVAVSASPPCQFATRARLVGTKKSNTPPNLIPQTRALLRSLGKPYVIENVEQARAHLLDPVMLCGSSFGLKVRRHRLFEASFPIPTLPCRHREQGRPVGVYHAMGDQVQGIDRRTGRYVMGGRTAATVEEGLDAMGITRPIPWRYLREAVPPAYTLHIGISLRKVIA